MDETWAAIFLDALVASPGQLGCANLSLPIYRCSRPRKDVIWYSGPMMRGKGSR